MEFPSIHAPVPTWFNSSAAFPRQQLPAGGGCTIKPLDELPRTNCLKARLPFFQTKIGNDDTGTRG